ERHLPRERPECRVRLFGLDDIRGMRIALHLSHILAPWSVLPAGRFFVEPMRLEPLPLALELRHQHGERALDGVELAVLIDDLVEPRAPVGAGVAVPSRDAR